MRRTPLHVLLAFSAALVAGGCVKTYQPPEEGVAAALIKFKFAYDQAIVRARVPGEAFNAAIVVSVRMQDLAEDQLYEVYRKRYAGAPSLDAATPLEIHAERFHPGRTATFTLSLAVTWQTREYEGVWLHYRVPVRVYDSSTRSYRTETRTERRLVYQWVTHDHRAGCPASTAFTPALDAVYLLDYTSAEIDADCTLQAYRQLPAGDGSFRLEPIGGALIGEPPP